MRKSFLVLLAAIVLSTAIIPLFAQPLEPIQGAYVVAVGDKGEGWAKTGADGVFLISRGLAEGTYIVTVYAKGFIAKTIDNVQVKANEETDLGDIVLEASGKIVGKVLDPNGKPVKGVLVELYKGNIFIDKTTTKDDGAFVFDTNLDTGVYKIVARPFTTEGLKYRVVNVGFQTYKIPLLGSVSVYSAGFTTGEKTGISVTKGKTTSNVVVQLGWSGIISGTVKDTDGKPVEGVLVIAFNPKEGYESGFYATTDKNGYYRIANNLKSGEYNVTILFPKGYVWNIFNAKKAVVKEGEETKNVDFVLEKSGVISGEVVYGDGRPAAFVNVIAFSQQGRYFGLAQTDINGKFRIDSGLGTGDYQVVAVSQNLFSTPVNVHVEAGKETKGVKLTIKGTGVSAAKIIGVVKDESGKPVSSATVEVPGNITQTDANGYYEITVKFTGASANLALSVSKRGYNSTSVKIQADAGKTIRKDVVIKRLPWGKIKGRVLSKASIKPIKPTIKLQLSATKVKVGDTVTVSGSIQPFKGETDIVIKITSPSGTKTQTLKTDSGAFSYTFKADVKGTWKIEVKVPKSTYYLESTATATLVVEEAQKPQQEKKCIIATVTFGSELTPEVQFLRNFRDNLILSTRSGSAFYIAFDAFYYSWSTGVAKFIEAHSWLKTPVKILIYPLLGILKITALLAQPLFSLNSEFAAVFAGFIASSLIGLVYLTPLFLIVDYVLRRRGKRLCISKYHVKTIGIVALASLFFIAIGLLLNLTPVLVASTSAYVLSLIALAPITLLRVLVVNRK